MVKKVLLSLLVLIFMGIMVVLSFQNSCVSNGWSNIVTGGIAGFLSWMGHGVQTLEPLNHVVRKVAHVLEYMVLATLLTYLFAGLSGRIMWGISVAWVSSLIFAGFDEWIQRTSLGRTSTISDVLIDAGGIALGVLIFMLIERDSIISTYKNWH